MVLAFDMAANQHMRAAAWMAAIHVANAVHRRLKAALGHAGHQPAAGLHVLRRVGRAVNTGFVSADLTQGVELGEETGGIDGGHAQTLAAQRDSLLCRWPASGEAVAHAPRWNNRIGGTASRWRQGKSTGSLAWRGAVLSTDCMPAMV